MNRSILHSISIIVIMGLTACESSDIPTESVQIANSVSISPAQPSAAPQIVTNEKPKSVGEIMDFLVQSVPEIRQYKQMIETNKSKVLFLSDGLISVLDRPGKYYDMYIGESFSDHVVRWNTFYVSEDMKEILVEDVITGNILTLEEWRKRGAK
ncbi:hypothetical protein LJR153_003966 [Paenibacillus sp. LjRoot153]|uniref:hypothetical protein n=1 Tax=Paenibacillus sp. LjRoot153 TaxID=3342270 RepID=UPI003ECC5CF7